MVTKNSFIYAEERRRNMDIICRSETQARDLLGFAKSRGYKWLDGDELTLENARKGHSLSFPIKFSFSSHVRKIVGYSNRESGYNEDDVLREWLVSDDDISFSQSDDFLTLLGG